MPPSMLRLLAFVACSLSAVATASTATFDAVTDNGVSMTFEIDSPVTMAATSAVVCLNTSTPLTEAKLWMVMDNGHQHGSTPTTIASIGNNCYRVKDINFVMTGEWQIRIKLANSDRGKFFVPVED